MRERMLNFVKNSLPQRLKNQSWDMHIKVLRSCPVELVPYLHPVPYSRIVFCFQIDCDITYLVRSNSEKRSFRIVTVSNWALFYQYCQDHDQYNDYITICFYIQLFQCGTQVVLVFVKLCGVWRIVQCLLSTFFLTGKQNWAINLPTLSKVK